MKTNIPSHAILLTLLAALTASIQLPAQQHHHYKVVDLGTLGGPNSTVPIVFNEINGTVGAQAISRHGTVAGISDSATADPLCFLDDCYYPTTFEWRNGVLTSLSALPGGQGSSPNWISGNGLIAGISFNGQTDPVNDLPELRAVYWRDKEVHDLGTLPGGYVSTAWGINSAGQVVGFSTNGVADPFSFYYAQILQISSGTQARAFSWDARHGMEDLGTLGGPDAWAALVNDRGDVAGISYSSYTPNANNGNCAPNVPPQEPFFWERSTGMIDIGNFGGTCGITNAINNRGEVAGQSYLTGNMIAHAFLWDKTGNPALLDLGSLGGDNASAMWLNDAGDVIGYADIPNAPGCQGLSCVHHAFLWRHGVMADLGTIGTDVCSRAFSINSKVQVVGASAVCGGNLNHGFLWENGGPAIDLNTLVQPGVNLALVAPISMNDRGEIAGYGFLPDGNTHAFVMIPCDDDHPNVEGCDYSVWDASALSR